MVTQERGGVAVREHRLERGDQLGHHLLGVADRGVAALQDRRRDRRQLRLEQLVTEVVHRVGIVDVGGEPVRRAGERPVAGRRGRVAEDREPGGDPVRRQVGARRVPEHAAQRGDRLDRLAAGERDARGLQRIGHASLASSSHFAHSAARTVASFAAGAGSAFWPSEK